MDLSTETQHQAVYRRFRPRLIRLAREAAQRANYSYRGFKVGAAVLAYRPDAPSRQKYRVFQAVNLKPLPEDGPKICAEQGAVSSALGTGYSEIIVICVAALPQPDDRSGIAASTLHLCWVCRVLFGALLKGSEDIIVLTVHNHEEVSEEFTLRQMIDLHTRGDT